MNKTESKQRSTEKKKMKMKRSSARSRTPTSKTKRRLTQAMMLRTGLIFSEVNQENKINHRTNKLIINNTEPRKKATKAD